jgi:tetratricopeptide (TPR) repeat protein
MKSLYELLGASADDDAEALKKAFRKVVKANHPDLHPDDLDAQARFREIIAAHALLRDPKQRATYDRLLQLERQQFQLKVERHQARSKLAHQQVRLKRTRAIAAVAAVGALVGGYGLFSHMSTTPVAINKDGLAAAAVAIAKEEGQAASAMVADNAQTAAGAPKSGAVKDNLENSADNAGAPVETTGAQVYGRESTPARPANDGNFYRERAIAAYSNGDLLGAVGNFDEAIGLNPDDAQSYNIRGNVWDELGIFERALADYDEAIRIDPDNPAVFHDRAIMWQHKGELDKALVDLDRAIRFSFSDARMYCDRGLVWYEKGHHDRAIADFNQAIRLDANSAAACIKRGLVLHRNSEFKLAFATVNQAIRVDPSVFDALRRANLRP